MLTLKLKKHFRITVGLILFACSNNVSTNELNWLAKDRLLISLSSKESTHRQHLLYNIHDQTISTFAEADRYKSYALSYTGRNILWYDDISMKFGSVERPLSKLRNIPKWITPPEDLDDYEKEHLSFELAAAWINDRYFLVSQSYLFTGRSMCMLFDTRDKKWIKGIKDISLTCPEHGGYLSIKNLQKDVLLITESAEGVLLHSLWGVSDKILNFPRWNLVGGYMRIYTHSNNAGKLFIASPCMLTSETPYPTELCKNQDSDTEILFSYNIRSQRITLVAKNMQPYASVNSYEPGTIAWLNNRKICISRLGKTFCKKISAHQQK